MSELMVADVEVMGMPLKQYKLGQAVAQVAEGKHGDGRNNAKWATVYFIMSPNQGKGEAQKLLRRLQTVYKDWDFGISVSLNPTMEHITKKLGIKEYA